MVFQWLKRYMPRGLYGRAALILVFPVVMLQLIVSLVFIQRHFEGVTEIMSRAVVQEITFLLDEMAAAPDSAAARAEAGRIADALDFDLVFDAAPDAVVAARPFYDLSGRVMLDIFSAAIPGLGPTDLSNFREVHILLDTPEGPAVLSFGRSRVSASNPHQLIVIMVVMGALMTLIAYLFLRNQLRPIKRMADAAADYGKGRVVPYTPSGAVEVRAAGMAFLEMRARIERQTQARTMMLSGISHDLRTPLTRLRLGLSMMDEEEAEPMVRDVADMERLVDAFLDYGREDAADAPEPTDPVAFLRQVAGDSARAGRAVELGRIDGIDDTAQVMLRPMALRRALENLIGNGLRYGGKVRLSLTASDRTLRFRVEDNGPGIPADQRDEAMRPFTRLDPARNQNRGTGVGLGLAIVADIARLHGGTLRLGESADMGGLCADIVVAR
ncbi:HAMP domain-containing protein [Loktanella sp. IMCC34160]|uniref:ATP-binding protein n=1 Tax=Loktanella sp. IMCC34160 TaxID=2510646 RepID=UPI00101CEC39|nr:ATP-binding protein [Loktanella sp. IMCC34160]RYG89719.1 HAMP domain-containing protein [Loktanella sp. IMCC34160]